MIWRLTDGLRKRGAFEDVTIVMVGDHGIVARCEKKYPLEPGGTGSPNKGDFPATRTGEQTQSNYLRGLHCQWSQHFVGDLKVENRKSLKVYPKEDLPRFYGEAKEGRGTSIGEEHMGAPNCRSKSFPQSVLLPAA
ncbi:hypothetical protein WN943_005943 [Citrus x changshan-huyou]